MSVAKLKKATLFYHKSIREEVLKTLQNSGVCEIIPAAAHGVGFTPEAISSASAKIAQAESNLTELRFLLRFLEPHYKDPVPALDRALGEKPVCSMQELTSLASRFNVQREAETVRSYERKLASIRLELSQIQNERAILTNIPDFPYTIDVFASKSRLRAELGNMPLAQLQTWQEALKEKIGADCEIYVAPVQPKAREVWVAVMYDAARENEVLEICAKNNLTVAEMAFAEPKSVKEELELLERRERTLLSEENSVRSDVARFSNSRLSDIRKLSDYWSIIKDRYDAMVSGEFTNSVVVTSFWVPAKDVAKIEEQLAAIGGVFEFVVADPAPEDNAPSMMTNTWSLPFENLTKLYSPPKYGKIDPTSLLAPFFFIFFGMCLGDAGYALVMGGLLYLVFKKYKKIPTSMKEFMKLFLIVSVSTFVYGVLTGSFFGDLLAVVPFLRPLDGIRQTLMVMDPMKDPILVLGISLAFGVFHLFFGMCVSMYDLISEGNYVDALGDKGGWLVLLSGLMLIGGCSAGALPEWMTPFAQSVAILGALVVMWYAGRTKKGIFSKIISGLLALYGATSWLGDILSYSRLLALGLASAAVAMIINMLGGLAADIPYVGWLIALVIVVGGHIFSIAVNVLGSFVHSLRLQYVEFFSKFYSGGGREYNPLACNPKYVELNK